MTAPSVSVVMPVYNGERYLRDAIDSMLAQSFRDFEFLIIDDASRDASAEIVRSYPDPRIRLVHNARNSGVSASLNRGLELARGAYIARMDADDMSRPERLARQLAFLDRQPRCGIVGSWTEIWEGSTRTDRSHRHSTDDIDIRYDVLFDSPFVHSTVVIRKAVFTAVGMYPVTAHAPYPEDFALWSRAARGFGMANIAEPLLVYREVPGSASRSSPESFRRHASAISADNLAHVLGVAARDDDVRALADYVHGVPGEPLSLRRTGAMIRLLTRAADAVSEERGADPARLRGRARARARSVVRDYARQVQRSLRRRASIVVNAVRR